MAKSKSNTSADGTSGFYEGLLIVMATVAVAGCVALISYFVANEVITRNKAQATQADAAAVETARRNATTKFWTKDNVVTELNGAIYKVTFPNGTTIQTGSKELAAWYVENSVADHNKRLRDGLSMETPWKPVDVGAAPVEQPTGANAWFSGIIYN